MNQANARQHYKKYQKLACIHISKQVKTRAAPQRLHLAFSAVCQLTGDAQMPQRPARVMLCFLYVMAHFVPSELLTPCPANPCACAIKVGIGHHWLLPIGRIIV